MIYNTHYDVILVYSEAIYDSMSTPKDQLAPSTVTCVNLGAGIIAGTAAAIISQPADTLLSKINKAPGGEGQSVTSRLVQMAGQLGAKGLFLGLGARYVSFFFNLEALCSLTNHLFLELSWLPPLLLVNSPSTVISSVLLVPPVVLKLPSKSINTPLHISRLRQKHKNIIERVCWKNKKMLSLKGFGYIDVEKGIVVQVGMNEIYIGKVLVYWPIFIHRHVTNRVP